MKKNLTHYRVTVVSLKSRRGFPVVPDDGIFISEGDVFSGYGHSEQRAEKYFDLWFSSYVDKEERDNFVTFGRVKRIEGNLFATRLGKFLVEEL